MRSKEPQLGTRRRKLGTTLIIFTGLGLLGSACAKLAGIPKVLAEMAAMGFDHERLLLIAILEIASAVLFLSSRTRALGLLLVSAFLGGAIATHVQHGQPVIQPASFLTLVWLGTWLRHREMLWSSVSSPARKDQSPAAGHNRALGAI